ncbi:aminoglycoside phosphotransferase family protein [Curvivirga aplysinae]|uniref:aminoglycoside phosphotransferase family protein n=1 Tax=Curvivirga aplysinae TaxID=2529852 RepID=UPI0012BC9612|nr:phosphotransferase [Curvivirga aplysinae]MTI08791.1 aminoglycoside phosphotransferase [Curvivirga aplysinae]
MTDILDPAIRQKAMDVFIARTGWGNAKRFPLAADASFRRYIRLEQNDQSAMLMDAPPEHEDTAPFIMISDHLNNLGFSAPKILERDEDDGFLLLEDFGDGTFTNLLNNGTSETKLYRAATHLLVALHNSPEAGFLSIPSYSQDILQQEADLLIEWYLPEHRGHKAQENEIETYRDAWAEMYNNLPPAKNTIVLRDFHVDNLMLLEDRSTYAQVGLLDFQDALLGHPAYDLMSLLEDARRDITQELQNQMLDLYFDKAFGTNRDQFMNWYNFLAAQRHAKVIGIFSRLYKRDGKDVYLQHIPRVCALLAKHLENPLMEPLKIWLEKHLPNFQEIPASLKAK